MYIQDLLSGMLVFKTHDGGVRGKRASDGKLVLENGRSENTWRPNELGERAIVDALLFLYVSCGADVFDRGNGDAV